MTLQMHVEGAGAGLLYTTSSRWQRLRQLEIDDETILNILSRFPLTGQPATKWRRYVDVTLNTNQTILVNSMLFSLFWYYALNNQE